MRKVTIADSLFLDHTLSASIGGENIGLAPTHFEWERADADVARFVTDSDIKNAKGPGQVAWLLEPFFLHPENYAQAMSKPFDAVLTHNYYFAQQPTWLWCPHGGSWIAFSEWGMVPKTKGVSMLISDKNTTPGHKLRRAVAADVGPQVDVFGLDQRVPAERAYKEYRYSIVIETEYCRGFFSERLINCLAVGTIPIYWGCPDIGEYFEQSAIMEFENVAELDFLLARATPEFYDGCPVARRNNLDLAHRYAICEDWLWRRYPKLFEENAT